MARRPRIASPGARTARADRARTAFRGWWERLGVGTMSAMRRHQEPDPGPPAVLVADAHEEVLVALCEALEAEGYRCVKARDGDAVLRELAGGGLAAAVLDIPLPGADTLEVVRRARERGVQTPVVLTAVSADPETRRQAATLGAIGPHEKPYPLAGLLADVRAAAPPPPPPDAAPG
jgi:CheY-like chemotaxis protein